MTTTTTYHAIRDGQLINAQESNGQGRIRALVAGYNVNYRPVNSRVDHRITPATRVRHTERTPVDWAHGTMRESPAAPIGDAAVSTAIDGIVIDADIDTDTDSGRSVYRRYASGALREWSIGYIVHDYRAEGGVWHLTDIEIVEVSAVLRGANPMTKTLDVAAASAGTPRVDVDAIARRHGMTDPDALSPALRAALDRAKAAETSDDGAVCTSMAMVAAQLREHAAEGIALTMFAELTWAWLAATGSPLTGHEPFLGEPSYKPVAPGLMDLVTVIPHNAGTVKAPVVGRTDPTAPIAYGNLAHDLALTATGETKKKARFPVSIKEDADVLTDAGRGEQAVLETLRRGTRAHLNAALLIADGSIDDFIGALEVAGTQQLNATGLSGVQVLSRAARKVHDAGFSGPLACIGHPSTVDQVFLGRSVREEVPAVSVYVASPQVPFGSCLIGDWREACSLYLGATSITSTPSDGINFRLSRTVFLAETRAHAAWNQPTAVVEVTNVATS